MSEKKQSSIEWFFIELMDVCTRKDIFECQSEFKKAKEMYDNEIEKAYLEGMQDCHRSLNKHLEDKTMSKLYTEEQVNELRRALRDIAQWDDVLEDDWEDAGNRAMDALRCFEKTTPIELPTDEEIENNAYSDRQVDHWEHEQQIGFQRGAKWMRDKIKGGDK